MIWGRIINSIKYVPEVFKSYVVFKRDEVAGSEPPLLVFSMIRDEVFAPKINKANYLHFNCACSNM